jgi:KUP system potassium uptake protein
MACYPVVMSAAEPTAEIHPATAAAEPAAPSPMALVALGALGVVFGDLATSPLYTLQTVVEAAGGHFTVASALGILSLLFWTLIVTVSIKYCLFVMRADNQGEGGILALMSLIGADRLSGRTGVLTFMGLLGAALIYGDGVITPAISVLSALEGVNVATDALKPYILPLAVAILVILFAAQRFGTGRIGAAFGPVMLLWCLVIAALGVSGVVREPRVFAAIDPRYAIGFLTHGGAGGLLVLGGVFLCITGGEALYADMGHFGKGPIRLAWYAIVLPALLLSYAGQTALLIRMGSISGNPFFQLAPAWAVYPLVILSTAATIIASQSIITGSFSMTRQAMQLGWLPAVSIRQTSDRVYGQIYVPVVNGMMMIATVLVAIAFGNSTRLAGAYGTAVSTTMLLTTGLLFVAMRKVWRWPLAACLLVGGVFLTVDLGFFVANLMKILDGGWAPLAMGAAILVIMATWRQGMDAMTAALGRLAEPATRLIADLEAGRIPRIPGTAVFLSKIDHAIPSMLTDHVKVTGVLRSHVIVLTVAFRAIPRVAEADRCDVQRLAEDFWRVTVHYGFSEIPDTMAILRGLKELGPDIDIDHATFFARQDRVIPAANASLISRIVSPLFAFLYRNSARVVDRFSLPADRVVEIGREIAI